MRACHCDVCRPGPTPAAGLCRWNLSPGGPARFGAVTLVLPVRRADGTPAVLKLQPVNDETVGEPAALAAWHGHGAVPLLDEPGDRLLHWDLHF
jgi:streptomycin 6-kinase